MNDKHREASNTNESSESGSSHHKRTGNAGIQFRAHLLWYVFHRI